MWQDLLKNAILKQNNRFSILFLKCICIHVLFSFESKFIHKFFWESGFLNFGHVTIIKRKAKICVLATILERTFLNFLFADLWLFYTDMVHVSYRNFYGKNGWVQVDPPCAQTGVKSSLGT